MITRTFAAFSLVAAIATPAFAQDDDRRAAAINDFIVAETYGHSLTGDAMTLDLSIQVTGSTVRITTEGGQPGAPTSVMVGNQEARVALDAVGVDGFILVNSVQTLATGRFDDRGIYSFEFEVLDHMELAKLCLQAASVRTLDDGTPTSLALSNGLKFIMKDGYRQAGGKDGAPGSDGSDEEQREVEDSCHDEEATEDSCK